MVRALLTDTPLEVHDGFDAVAVANAAQAGATLTSLVPTALARIDASAFRAILLGGSAMPAERPPNTVATYGLTETFSGVVYGAGLCAASSCAPLTTKSSCDARCCCAAIATGTDPRTDDSWFATGDAGAVADDGRLSVFGRVDDMITSGAEKVWPVAIERILAQHPGVAEVAVVGRPDPEWGQAVTAVVVPADPAGPPSLDELRDAVKLQLPAYCAPRTLELVDTLPKTPLGKTQRWRI